MRAKFEEQYSNEKLAIHLYNILAGLDNIETV
jgi:hypothetical protein